MMHMEYTLEDEAQEKQERFEELIKDGRSEEDATMIMRGQMPARMTYDDVHDGNDYADRDVEF
jgi:hypothetical protein